MHITKKNEASKLVLELDGRIDTLTAPALEAELKQSINGINELIIDFKDIEYISSAGLRVILSAQKVMNTQGSMIIKNVNKDVMEIFDITGFADFLTIE